LRFALPERSLSLAAALRQLLERACTPAVVRAAWPGGDDEAVAELWRTLAGTGVLGLLVAEEDGGLGLDELDLVAVLEETGRAAVPLPLVETTAFVAPLLGAVGRPGELSALLAGDLVATVQPPGDGPAPYGQRADLAVAGEMGALVLLRAPGAEVIAVATIDGGRAAARLRGDGEALRVEPELAGLSVERATLATSAQLVGVSSRMLDMTVEYVRNRKQFGVAVGSFQAVKHMLADALSAVEFARPAVWRAAASLVEREPTAHRDVSIAKVLASDCGERVARVAIQCHGAMGYTVECDLHLFAKRAWALARDWGTLEWHTGEVARAIGL
jgi:alkylation response protein AidB-like acyl-CoA dehydrogenase